MSATRSLCFTDTRVTKGERVSASVQVPAGSTHVGVAIERKGWTAVDGPTVRATVEFSADQSKWFPLGSVEAGAGEVRDRQGSVIPETKLRVRLPRAQRGVALFARARIEAYAEHEGAVALSFDDEAIPQPPTREHNSVTYDNDAEATATAAATVTLSSFTVGNNANRAMVVGVASWDDTGANLVNGVTLGGSATGWSELIEEQDAGDNAVAIWGCVAPAVGSANIVVTMSGTVSELGANAVSVHDAHQTNTFGTPNHATGTNSSLSCTVSAAVDGMVYDVAYVNPGGNSITVGASQTSRCNAVIVSGANIIASTEAGAASVAMTWSVSGGGAAFWIQVGVAINVAAAGDPPPEITSIDPDEGSESGGTVVTATGTGFVDGCTVTVGGNAATNVTFNSSTEIEFTTPAGTVGAADVVVTNPDDQTDTLTNGFTYTEDDPPASFDAALLHHQGDTDMIYLRKYNTALSGGTVIRRRLLKADLSGYATSADWTPGAGDVVTLEDNGTAANIGTLPTYEDGAWTFVLSAAETSCKQVEVLSVDAALFGDHFVVETFGNASAMLVADISADQIGVAGAGLTAIPTVAAVTTVTNLTNAPTAGDFTATMKTSIGTAVAASAVASVTGNVGGNVVGSIGSLAAQAKADVNAEADAALSDYDPPTKAELDAADDAVLAAIAALNNLSSANVQTVLDACGITTAGGVTRIATVDLATGGAAPVSPIGEAP